MQKEEYNFWRDYYFGLIPDALNEKEQLIINKFNYYLDAKIPTNEFMFEVNKCGSLNDILFNKALINFLAKQFNVTDELIKIKICNINKNLETKKTR